RGDDRRLGVLRVEDVRLAVAADQDCVEVEAAELNECVSRKLHLAQAVVPELEVRRDLHQSRPVGAGPVAHRWGIGVLDPVASIVQVPSKRTAPVASPAGNTKSRSASSSACSGWPLAGSVRATRT